MNKSNDFVSNKIYDKRNEFGFNVVNVPFLDGDVPRSPAYCVYSSQLIRFARVLSHVTDFKVNSQTSYLRDNGIINFGKRSLNLIDSTMNEFPGLMLG